MHYLADPRHSFCPSVRDSDLLGIDIRVVQILRTWWSRVCTKYPVRTIPLENGKVTRGKFTLLNYIYCNYDYYKIIIKYTIVPLNWDILPHRFNIFISVYINCLLMNTCFLERAFILRSSAVFQSNRSIIAFMQFKWPRVLLIPTL